MKMQVELELRDVYGGDGELRYEEKEKVTLSRTRTKKMIRDTIGVAVSIGTEEELKEKKLESIHTFRLEKDAPVLRLGGSHGKLWGAMNEAAKQLYNLGDKDFAKGYSAVLGMMNITPVWVTLETKDDFKLEGIPQVMKGRGGGMIVQHFDVIPKAVCTVELLFPDLLEKKVNKLLSQLEIGSHLNKRRSTIKVIKTSIIKSGTE